MSGTSIFGPKQELFNLMGTYGVRWTNNDSSPALTKGIVSGGVFVPFNYVEYPIQQQMKRCVLTHNTGVLNYYLLPTDSTKKDDGSAATLTGAAGQVMVQVPTFEYLICTDGNYTYFLVGQYPFHLVKSDTSIARSVLHPWFLEGGVQAAHKYISAFEPILYRSAAYVNGDGTQTGTAGDLIHSVYGYLPLTYFHRTERRTYSVDGVFHQIGYWANEAMILLYLTEYANWYSQSATYGVPGYTESSTWDFATYVCKTGISVVLGNASGSVSWGSAISALRCGGAVRPVGLASDAVIVCNSFRGIENFYGHLWKWIDGININFVGAPLTEASPYVCNNPSQWADNTLSNYTDVGFDLPLASEYQTNTGAGSLLPNAASGGSSSTYITDYYWASSAAGWRALLAGGGLNGGASAGVAARLAGGAASARDASIGGRVAA
jgi:hypothetical protein